MAMESLGERVGRAGRIGSLGLSSTVKFLWGFKSATTATTRVALIPLTCFLERTETINSTHPARVGTTREQRRIVTEATSSHPRTPTQRRGGALAGPATAELSEIAERRIEAQNERPVCPALPACLEEHGVPSR
jgi:hypothetical protein